MIEGLVSLSVYLWPRSSDFNSVIFMSLFTYFRISVGVFLVECIFAFITQASDCNFFSL